MIGRELGDPKHIRWMSCANKGMTILKSICCKAKDELIARVN